MVRVRREKGCWLGEEEGEGVTVRVRREKGDG